MWRFAVVCVIACSGPAKPVKPVVEAPVDAAPAVATPTGPADCEVPDPEQAPPAVAFPERSIVEAGRLAAEARTQQKTAESAEIEQKTREGYLTDAIKNALTALAADPYNAEATYILAGVYARFGARQCAVNMLARVGELAHLASQRANAEARLDRLLGRNKQPLDPDFADLRGDGAFRALVQAILSSGELVPTKVATPSRLSLEVQLPAPLPRVPAMDDTPVAKPKPGERPATRRVTLTVLEARTQSAGITVTLGCAGKQLAIGARGALITAKGVVPGGGVTITKVGPAECEARSALAIAAYPIGATAVFDVAAE